MADRIRGSHGWNTDETRIGRPGVCRGRRDAYPIPETLWLVNEVMSFRLYENGRWVFWRCLEKRSQALLGSNLTRDIRADGALRVLHRAPAAVPRGRFLETHFGHRRHASKNPRLLIVWTSLCQLWCRRRHERCATNYPLRARACRRPAAAGVAQHGCAAIEGPNYERVCPSGAGTTIGWRGSFERTECSGPARSAGRGARCGRAGGDGSR